MSQIFRFMRDVVPVAQRVTGSGFTSPTNSILSDRRYLLREAEDLGHEASVLSRFISSFQRSTLTLLCDSSAFLELPYINNE